MAAQGRRAAPAVMGIVLQGRRDAALAAVRWTRVNERLGLLHRIRNPCRDSGAIPCEHGQAGGADGEAKGHVESEVVERAQRGDHDAFATLVGATVARSDAVARLILRDPERAKDAIQDAYVRAWRDLPTLRYPERFEAWLRRLVVHACLNEARRARRRPLEVELLPIDQLRGGRESCQRARRPSGEAP
jgi:Sigma-70 region 2